MKMLAALLLCISPLQEPRYPVLPLGSAAPDFDLPGGDGRRWRLQDFAAHKLLLVVFDTVHCPTSQNYEERLKKVFEDYKDKGVGMIAISPNFPPAVRLDELGYSDLDDSLASITIRARDHKIPYPFCYDGEPNKVSQAYGPKATPHCFLFDAERKLRYQGGVDDHENPAKIKMSHLRIALDALLAGQAPPAAETKVFGCSTKWPHKVGANEEYNARIAAEPVEVEAADAAALAGLLKNDSGKVRLIHVWSPSDASQLPALVEMHHMYRRRNFQLVLVAVGSPASKEAVLAALKKQPPAASNRNLLVADPAPLAPGTLLIGAANEVLLRKTGAFDVLELRRAIVRNLKEDRLR